MVESASPSGNPEPSASSADAAVHGSWLPKPLAPSIIASEVAAVEGPCRAALAAAGGDAALGAASPRVIADFRGLGVASLVFAGAEHAASCRATISADLAVRVTAARDLGPLGPAPAENRIEFVEYSFLDDVPGGRTYALGRAGRQSVTLIAGFPDESEALGSLGSGWYLVWWPGNVVPTGIAGVDMRRLVVHGMPPPTAAP